MQQEIFDSNSIIRRLINKRVRLAKKSHDRTILDGYSKAKEPLHSNPDNELIYRIMPPRNKWRTLTKKERNSISDSIATNKKRLLKTISIDQQLSSKPYYLVELNKLVEKIQTKGKDAFSTIDSPRIIPKKKDPNFEEKDLRPICVYSLIDNTILQEVNFFLTNLFDTLFLKCSFAFRARTAEGKILTHHDTIQRINEYKKQHEDKQIYVAECDLQKFFDTINHKVIRKEFFLALGQTGYDLPDDLLLLLEHIFFEYLNSFDYQKSIKCLNDDSSYMCNFNCVGGKFKWVDESLLSKMYQDYHEEKLGIPQGGALSGLIANLVLNAVDKAVIDDDRDFLYLRYCDDMIMMHTDKEKLEVKFLAYQQAIKQQKLFVHEPEKIKTYSKGFYSKKSKQPYPWGPAIKDGQIPWVSFVGYQVGFNGEVRVRKKSIEKEMTKQETVARRALRHIRNSNSSIQSKRKICSSLYNRFVGMSVGRVHLYDYSIQDNKTMCWTNGFRELNQNKFAFGQMRFLDRTRRKWYAYFCEGLNKEIPKHLIVSSKRKRKQRQIVYWGKPFSYYGWLENKK